MKVIGVAGLDLMFTAVGFAVLYGLGLVRSRASGIRLVGLALLSGWAAVGVSTSFLLMAGATGTATEVTLLAGALAASGLVLGRFAPALRQPRAWRSSLSAAAIGAGGLLLLLASLAELFRNVRLAQPAKWDAWAFWVPKAEAIVYTGGFHTGPGTLESFANPDYPPLAPTLDATAFRFARSVDPGLLPLQHWVIAAALFVALAGLLWARVHPAILFPTLAVLSMLPIYQHDVGSLLGDETLLTAFAVAGVAAGLWLIESKPAHLGLYALFGSAMALAKNEGFTYVIAIAVLLGLVGLRRSPRAQLVLLAVPVAAMLPWKLWSDLNHVPPNDYYRFSSLLHPVYLADRSGRLWHTLAALPQYYGSFDRWLLTLPVAALLLPFVARRRPGLALFVVGTVAVGFLGNVIVYWISPSPLDWYISTSGDRTSTGPLIFVAALMPLLAAEALAQTDEKTAIAARLATS